MMAFAAPFLSHSCLHRPTSSTTICSLPRMITSNNKSSDKKILAGPFKGHYGSWNFTSSDARSITLYRLSLLLSSLSTLPPLYSLFQSLPPYLLDLSYLLWFASMAASLHYIHIYLKPLHNFLKFLLYSGFAITLIYHYAIPSPPNQNLLSHVFSSTLGTLAFAPQAAALTGIFFKEAFCFRKPEALVLTFATPALTLAVMNGVDVRIGAVAAAVTYVLLGARKFTQDAVEDLGDKSVFEHLEKKGSL